MRQAEARVKAEEGEEGRFEDAVYTLWHLHKTLSLEAYFQALEEFITRARHRLEEIPDVEERNRRREYYTRVIEAAVNLACGVKS